MIKLNNKNITYIALADTNNSLKAPKEIWYADSSNSVKLVYRRKDTLIEGEDYDKYHWLVGDADAYINTLKYYRPYDDSVQMTFRDNLYPNRESKYNKHNAEEQIWGACIKNTNLVIRSYISGAGYDSTNKIGNNVINQSTTDGDVNWGGYTIGSFINDSPEHSLYISSVDANTDKYYFIYNGNTKSNLPTRYTLPELVQQDVRIFTSGEYTNGYFNGSFAYFIHYRNNVEITHLIPCKLLKPVPKWLDANGIRRQVGECGMIDLASGKFYGNVNSTGTFTVENYYERKEWLSVQTTEKVTMMILPLNTSNFKYSILLLDRVPNLSYFTSSWHTYGVTDTQTLVFIYDRKNSTIVYSCQTGFQLGDIIMVDSTDEDLLFNNISIPKYGFPAENFIIQTNNNVALNMRVSSITVNNKERYIPCTLTMDLPASMDANNIARTKGTSGMWDLVSDRFYGNVANSGTFKAVNLAEGVDYEVHQWLKTGSGKPYIQVADGYNTDNEAYLETTFKGASVNGDKDIIIGFGSDNSFGYRLFVGGQAVFIDIHKRTSGVLTSKRLSFSYSPYQICHVFINPNRYEFNNVAGTYELGNGFDTEIRQSYTLILTNQSNNDMYYAETKMRVNNVEYDLIPVKLLRSIPSKYDANGIARQAGECGMYDTVNDVFYGNVASSGSFTVEDDS